MKCYRFTSLLIGLVSTICTGLGQIITVGGTEYLPSSLGATNRVPLPRQANELPLGESAGGAGGGEGAGRALASNSISEQALALVNTLASANSSTFSLYVDSD